MQEMQAFYTISFFPKRLKNQVKVRIVIQENIDDGSGSNDINNDNDENNAMKIMILN